MSRRPVIIAVVVLAVAAALAATIFPVSHGGRAPRSKVVVLGTSGESLLAPAIRAFHEKNPSTTIEYHEMDGLSIYRKVADDLAKGRSGADFTLSTSMDLQVKLVNDGASSPHVSQNAAALPPWARWRNEAFGVTFEPIVMVFNTNVMHGRTIPRSRSELLEAIAADPAFWRGRIGTFDPRRSGTGYLMLSQDYRQSGDASALFRAFGESGVFLDEDSSAIFRKLDRGELAMSYNSLSSYARRRQAAGAPLEIVFPHEFTLAILRTAVIPRNAANPQGAHAFLEFLLSPEGQRALSRNTGFYGIREDAVTGGIGITESGIVRPVPLGPGLLVYLDQHKRRRLLENWDSLMERQSP